MKYYFPFPTFSITECTNCRRPIGLYNSRNFDEPFSILALNMVCNGNPQIYPADDIEDIKTHTDFYYYTLTGDKVTVDSKVVNYDKNKTPYISIGKEALNSKFTTHISFVYGYGICILSIDRLRGMIYIDKNTTNGFNGSEQEMTRYNVDYLIQEVNEDPNIGSFIPIDRNLAMLYSEEAYYYFIYAEQDRIINKAKKNQQITHMEAQHQSLNNLNEFANRVHNIIERTNIYLQNGISA